MTTLIVFALAVPLVLLVVAGMIRIALFIATLGPPSVREGWTTGVVGRMGQGKSLYCMTIAHRHLKSGGTVVCNFRVDDSQLAGTVVEFRGWVPLLEVLVERLEGAPRGEGGRPDVRPALVLLDEAHLYAPASGQVLPEVARWILSHLRKLRCELMWCSQHEDRVSVGLRQQTAELVLVKRSQLGKRNFTAAHWEPEKFRKQGQEAIFKVHYRLSRRYTDLYRSWELIQPDVHGDEAGIVATLIDRLQTALGANDPVDDEKAPAANEGLPLNGHCTTDDNAVYSQ